MHRSTISLTLAAMSLFAMAAPAAAEPVATPTPERDVDAMRDHFDAVNEALARPDRTAPRHRITKEDSARWDAERQAKRAARATKLAAIRDAQLARGQRTA